MKKNDLGCTAEVGIVNKIVNDIGTIEVKQLVPPRGCS
jgi:hypothetical protein